MSFKFNWNCFNEENFYSRAKTLLTDALNKSNKPPIIVDKINVEELSLGDKPPKLEILEIGDLADDRFRGIFKLNYSGNGSITLATKVEANPLNVYAENSPSFSKPKFAAASTSLPMPLNLTLSEIKLSGIIILVFSKARGLTLVFRNDPLESIKVSSTFDALPGIAKFLQVQIENQIRLLFREELPTILHKLSHRWTPGSTIIEQEPKSTAKPISLVDINPGAPEFSPSNMLKLDMLLASQRTLSLFTPSIPDVVYRSNLESFERKKRKEEKAIQTLDDGDDLTEIMKIQSRNNKITHKPKRRVIKVKPFNKPEVSTSTSQEQITAQQEEKVQAPLQEEKPAPPSPVPEEVETTDTKPMPLNTWAQVKKDPAFNDFFSSNILRDDPPPYVA
jgi:distribution and morphology protein 34